MAAPTISKTELDFYGNKPLTDNNWKVNFEKVIEWLTAGTYNLKVYALTTLSNISTTGNITASGNITGTHYGDGSNLSGITVGQIKNFVINGCGIVDQKASDYTLLKDTYGIRADRFYGMATGTAVSAGTLTTTTAANCGRTGYAIKFNNVTLTGTGVVYLRTRIEASDAVKMKNQDCSFQSVVYHDVGSAKNYTIYINKANSANDFSAVTAIGNSGALAVSSATETQIKYEDVAMGDCSTGVEIIIKVECGAITTKDFEFTEMQLEVGSVITNYEHRQYELELTLCQRYKTETANVLSLTTAGQINNSYPETMAPTGAWNPTGAWGPTGTWSPTGAWTFTPSSAIIPISIVNAYTDDSIYINQSGVLGTGNYGIHVYSDAVQINTPLIGVKMDNASSTTSCISVVNDGTGHGIIAEKDNVVGYAVYGKNTDGTAGYFESDRTTTHAVVILHDGNDVDRYGLLILAGTDGAASHSRLITFAGGDGTIVGSINSSDGVVSLSSFTGNHPSAMTGNKTLPIGCVVKLNSAKLKGKCLQAKYIVGPTIKAKDKSVFGVYAGREFDEKLKNSHRIYGVGDGFILVCKEGGNIEKGDYLTSSNKKGHAMKQDDDLLHNYTVAKSLENVDWSKEKKDTKLIACTYHAS